MPMLMIMVVYLSESKWNTTFWKRKIAMSNGTSEKVVLFFRMANIFQTVSGLRGRFPVNATDLYK